MGYFLAFGLVYIGYALVDWGHYVLKHEQVTLWYLMSGVGTPPVGTVGANSTPIPGQDPNAKIPGTQVPARVIPPATPGQLGYHRGRNI